MYDLEVPGPDGDEGLFGVGTGDVRTIHETGGSHSADGTGMIRADADIRVVVTDIVMPEMNGFDLADQLHEVAPAVRIVFMSGFTSDHFKQSVSAPFVAKPFTPESLAAGVARALS